MILETLYFSKIKFFGGNIEFKCSCHQYLPFQIYWHYELDLRSDMAKTR